MLRTHVFSVIFRFKARIFVWGKEIPVTVAAAHAAPVSVYFKLRIFCSFLKTNFSFLENIFWAPEFQ